MRKVNNIVIHCSAGFGDAKATQAWFLRPKKSGGQGWNTGGYHIIIDVDGTIHQFYDFNRITNGVFGYNASTIHICYIGGIELINGIYKAKDTRTPQQKESLHKAIYKALRWCFDNGNLSIGVVGHRDFSPDLNKDGRIQSWERIKECPSFDAIEEYSIIYATSDRTYKLPSVL